MVLASVSHDTNLEELAQMADAIVEVATLSVSAVDGVPHHLTTEIEQLCSEVASLTMLVKFLTQHRRPSSLNPSHQQSSTDLCWYHQRYGESARKCIEPCSKSGKCPSQPLVVTSMSGHTPSHLFYIKDHSSGLTFLVDTGTQVSVIPPTSPQRKHRHDGFQLQAVNNSSIATYGN